MDALLNNERILAALLAEYSITNVVFSVGAEESLLKKELDACGRYHLFHAVDERNAAYFALGLALELQKAVAVVCSSDMAATNFLPAAAEAYYQNLPLLMIAERTLGKKAGAEIGEAMGTVTKASVSFPAICDARTERKNVVDMNEALHALMLYGTAPVFLAYQSGCTESVKTTVPVIKCVSAHREPLLWKEKAEELLKAGGCAVVLETDVAVSQDRLCAFAEAFDCAILTSAVSHIELESGVSLEALLAAESEDLACPDYVITLSAESNSKVGMLFAKYPAAEVKHWHVDISGSCYDAFGRLDTVFAAYANEFFDELADNAPQKKSAGYRQKIAAAAGRNRAGNGSAVELVNCFAERVEHAVVQDSCEEIPLTNICWNKTVEFHSTVESGNTIGCLSMFLGMARLSEKPCYLIIDDVAFYNDMNALMLRDIGTHVKIILLNTGRAEAAAYQAGIAVNRSDRFREWANSLGFDYMSASDSASAEECLTAFMSFNSDLPVLLEVVLSVGGVE